MSGLPTVVVLSALILKITFCSLIGLGVSAIALFVTDAVATHWYVFSKGVSSVKELSDDYGFAMLLVFWYVVVFLITFPMAVYFSWKHFFARKN